MSVNRLIACRPKYDDLLSDPTTEAQTHGHTRVSAVYKAKVVNSLNVEHLVTLVSAASYTGCNDDTCRATDSTWQHRPLTVNMLTSTSSALCS